MRRYRARWTIAGLQGPSLRDGREIAPGEIVELDPEDPAVADLLANSEVLELLPDLPPEPEDPTSPSLESEPLPDPAHLERLTKAELRGLAAERGLELDPDEMTKAEMIAAIEAHG